MAAMNAYRRPADHDRRMDAMRDRAAFELGDPSWAGVLFAAYEDPERDAAELEDSDGEW